ncbi:hypothetical protein X943_003858 [Babesia divergens]|uniref:Uncharacterized protein n=1 Tax=Babesia divergens TaxID=32595 RepID=A0AAD9GJR8_BABDI|nr:hypothetical protein X943_003858 [Babesia divergens]
MRQPKCSLSRLVEAFVVGSMFLMDYKEFELLLAVDRVVTGRLYLLYQVMIFSCFLIGLAMNGYRSHYLSCCLLLRVACCIGSVLRMSITRFIWLRILEVMMTAAVTGFNLMLAGCDYSNNPASAVAMLYGAFCSAFFLKVLSSCVRTYSPYLPESLIVPRIVLMIEIAKICTSTLALVIRLSNDGKWMQNFIKDMRDDFEAFKKLDILLYTWLSPGKYLVRVWNGHSVMCETLANIAVMIAIMITAKPSTILMQLPISPFWLAEIMKLEMWAFYAGLLTGGFVPLPDAKRFFIRLVIFTAFFLHVFSTGVFLYFTRTPWIKPWFVNAICASICWLYGYAIPCTLSRVITVFFMRSCWNTTPTDRCCQAIIDGDCFCKTRTDYHSCESGVEPIKAADAEEKEKPKTPCNTPAATNNGNGASTATTTTPASTQPQSSSSCVEAKNDEPPPCKSFNHIIWAHHPELPTKRGTCTPLKCLCKDTGNANKGCLICCVKHTSGKCQCPCECPTKDKKVQKDIKCFCADHLNLDCSASCKPCECKSKSSTCDQLQCYELITGRCTQHYILGSTHVASCGSCDLTIILEGTPIGSPGEVCCLPAGRPYPRPSNWKRYNPATDRVYIGYIDSGCSVCSLVEIRTMDHSVDHCGKDICESDNIFNITNFAFGACCHSYFNLRVDCRMINTFPYLSPGKSPYKTLDLAYVCFTTAGVSKAECEAMKKKPQCQCDAANKKTDGACSGTLSDKKSPCCFGVARKVVTYRRCPNSSEKAGLCIENKAKADTSEKYCLCNNQDKCAKGCCVKVPVTDDASTQKLRDSHRLTVVARFWIFLFLFFLVFQGLTATYGRNGVNKSFRFPLDVKRLWTTVNLSNWSNTVLDSLADSNSEVLKVKGYDTEEGFKDALSLLSLCIPDKLDEFEEMVTTAVTTHFPGAKELEDHKQYYSLCVSLSLFARNACFEARMDALRRYFLQWEGRWQKELGHYNEMLESVISGHMHVYNVAKSFGSAITATNLDKQAVSQIGIKNWRSILDELKQAKAVNEQEILLQNIKEAASPDYIPTVRDRLEIVWQRRVEPIMHWMRMKRCLYNWSSFLHSYNTLQHYYHEEDKIMQRS